MTVRGRNVKLARYSRAHTRLSDQQAAFIAHLVDELPPGMTVTWNTIVDLGRRHFQVAWTRQTLEKRSAIKEAYLRRIGLRGVPSGTARKKLSSGDSDTDRRVQNLRAENEKLRAVLHEYDCRLVRYVANALAHGLTEAQLDAPLRPVMVSSVEPRVRR
ncbi:hypothethical protein [Ralstonia solanacearum PSI07]|nr:hypothethical protein [Ralstonia solanacearum PSI07]